MLMRKFGFIGVLVWIPLLELATGAWAAVNVANLIVAQRTGTKLVDISYDVNNTEAYVASISLTVRNSTETVRVTRVSGDIGLVDTGVGKSIVWDMGVDWNGNFAVLTFTLRAEVAAPDGGDPTATSCLLMTKSLVKNTYADGAITMSDLTSPSSLMWVYNPGVNGVVNWHAATNLCYTLV